MAIKLKKILKSRHLPHFDGTEDDVENHSDVNYELFVRPLVAKLLKAFNLNKNFIEGEGNWLSTDKDHQQYLDVTGGFGANALGHKNPYIQEIIIQQILYGSPVHLQGSIRKGAGQLAQKVSSILEKEVASGPWISHFSNSGTEAIESALKHSLLNFQERLIQLQQIICESQNNLNRFISDNSYKNDCDHNSLSSRMFQQTIDVLSQHPGINQYFNSEIFEKNKIETWDQLNNFINIFNENNLNSPQYIVSLDGGFHGKTIGSLSATSNETFWSPFGLRKFPLESIINITLPKFIENADINQIEKELLQAKRYLIVLDFKNKIDPIKVVPFFAIISIILEPIQGEAGIHILDSQYLYKLREFTLQNKIPFIVDEIQSGLYRTGMMAALSHEKLKADIYCFSKGLGGGYVKIGLTVIHKSHYLEDFGKLHTSTFAEDDISSNVALKVLQLIEVHQNKILQTLQHAEQFKLNLIELKKIFPDVIFAIRGKGLMLAVEFQSDLANSCYEFKFFSDSKMLGYVFSGAMLYQDQIRIMPTLSSPMTLRIEPSLYTTQSEFKKIYEGIKNLSFALKNFNGQYLFEHLFPHYPIGPLNCVDPQIFEVINPQIPTVAFLSHAIDITEIKKFMRALKFIPCEIVNNKFKDSGEIAEFGVSYSCVIKDKNENAINFLLVSFPLTSEIILKWYKGQNRHKLTKKIQSGLDLSTQLGASVIGLGQFTSIVTKNGLLLNCPENVNITTGNAYTCALTIEATIKSAKDKNIDLENCEVSLIGAAGNILSVSAVLMAENVQKINLIHHCPIDQDSKFLHAVFDILMESKNSQSQSPCVIGIKKCLSLYPLDSVLDVVDFLKEFNVNKYIEANHNLQTVIYSQIIITGTNSTKSILNEQNIPRNSIVVDLGVPANVSSDITTTRPDITYILGGLAELPDLTFSQRPESEPTRQGIQAEFFPLESGEIFACMAETISLGFIDNYYKNVKDIPDKSFRHLGGINKNVVKKTQKFADIVGIKLGKIKTRHSF